MTRKEERELVAWVRRVGLDNIWCKTHNRPMADSVDPLTTSYHASTIFGVPLDNPVHRLFCTAWFDLPQSEGCFLILKSKRREHDDEQKSQNAERS